MVVAKDHLRGRWTTLRGRRKWRVAVQLVENFIYAR